MYRKGRLMNWKHYLSNMTQTLPPSGIRKFWEKAMSMDDVISLCVGEPDYIPPHPVLDALVASVERGETNYSPNAGILPLREAISNWYNRRYHVHYGTDEMMLTIGASEAIDLSLRALLNEGDEVLIPNPSYVAHQAEVHMCDGKAIPVPTHLEDGFKLRVEELEKLITDKTKAILMCYPSNPTGAIMDYEDLLPIAEFAKSHNLIIISDEIYSELTYHKDHVSMASLPGMKERTIILNGFSKSYAMTGLRIGFLCAPSEFITACIKLHQYSIVAPATPVQHAAIVALNECDDSVIAMRQDYLERRDMIMKGFQDMGLPIAVPEGAFYAFPDISQTGLSDEDFCEQLLEQQHVAVVPGSAFGTCGANRIRCSYASSKETIQEALRRIKLFLDTIHN